MSSIQLKALIYCFLLEMAILVPVFIFDALSLYQQSVFYMLISYAFIAAFLIIVIFDVIRGIIKSPVVNTNLRLAH